MIAFSGTAVAQTVSGTVWQDDNGDGFIDPAEPGVEAVRVTLLDQFLNIVGQATTDSLGYWELTGIAPYNWYLLVVPPNDGGIPVLQDAWLGLGDVPPGWIPTADPPDGSDFPYESWVWVPEGGLTDQNFGFQPARRVTVVQESDPVRGNAVVELDSGPGAGTAYGAQESLFTPSLDGSPVTGALVAADPLLACSPLANGLDVAGRIALIQRGACPFVQKVAAAYDAGAIAAIVFNVPGQEALVTMASNAVSVPIPAVFVGNSHGQELLGSAGEFATLSFFGAFSFSSSFGDFDLSPLGELTSPDVGKKFWLEQTDGPDGWQLTSAECLISDLKKRTAKSKEPQKVDMKKDPKKDKKPKNITLKDGELAYCTFVNSLE